MCITININYKYDHYDESTIKSLSTWTNPPVPTITHSISASTPLPMLITLMATCKGAWALDPEIYSSSIQPNKYAPKPSFIYISISNTNNFSDTAKTKEIKNWEMIIVILKVVIM